jgi:hypothetical protein
LITNGPNGLIASRPDAPYELDDLAAAEWRAIVGCMPPGYFARSHYAMLSQLCRHIVASNRVSMLVEACCKQRKLDYAHLETLHRMQSSESASIVRLCRQLRLTHQAIYRADSTKQRPVANLPPWHRKPDNPSYDVEEND